VSKRERRHFSPDEKARILKEHLVEGKAISEICDTYGIHPTVFHRWQQQLFVNAASAFEKKEKRMEARWQKKVGKLERKIQHKNEVLAELMEEHIALKKSLGEED
jgi:transposase-like protein